MESESSQVSVPGVDGEGESEREGKKGGTVGVGVDWDDPDAPCQLCDEPMGRSDPQGREWRGSYHVPCIVRARRRVINEMGEGYAYAGRRRPRRGQ